jgi:predicted GIY-YIG superfamily endonuclease
MALSAPKGIPHIYLLRLKSGALYTGCTEDLEMRLREHEAGTACRTTAIDPPVSLDHFEAASDLLTARRREAQIKRWSRAKKEALIRGDLATLKRLSQSRD